MKLYTWTDMEYSQNYYSNDSGTSRNDSRMSMNHSMMSRKYIENSGDSGYNYSSTDSEENVIQVRN